MLLVAVEAVVDKAEVAEGEHCEQTKKRENLIKDIIIV